MLTTGYPIFFFNPLYLLFNGILKVKVSKNLAESGFPFGLLCSGLDIGSRVNLLYPGFNSHLVELYHIVLGFSVGSRPTRQGGHHLQMEKWSCT